MADEPQPVRELELPARIQSKLGRALTPHELKVLSAPPRRSVLADKQEMPDIAREMYEVVTSLLKKQLLGVRGSWDALQPDPAKPYALKPEQFRMLRIASLVSIGLPLCFGLGAWTDWQWQIGLLRSDPQADIGFPIQPLILCVGTLLLPLMLWQHADSLHALGQLPGSGILEQIGDGSAESDSIVDHTPIPWRWIFMGGGTEQNLRSRVLLVANYLDWFLDPPRVHFRWYWAQAVLTVIGAAVLGSVASHFSSNQLMPPLFQALLGLFTGVQALGIPLGLAYAPKRQFCTEILRQLRQRFGVSPPSTAEAWVRKQEMEVQLQAANSAAAHHTWQESVKQLMKS